MESTFVMIKPDGVQRHLTGNVISIFENKGLRVAALKMMHIPTETAEEHYGEHKGKPFYDSLISYITSGPVVAMVLQGREAVSVARKVMGSTDPTEADPGTIRFMYGMDIARNIVHGSDSLESARREIGLFFSPDEVLEYIPDSEKWIYE